MVKLRRDNHFHNFEERLKNAYDLALTWVKENSTDHKGIVVTSQKRYPYLEVTGYLIPTLIDAGELNLAFSYGEFLSVVQRPSGVFAGPDGREYFFDTGQVLRGFNSLYKIDKRFKAPLVKAADYMCRQILPTGQIPSIYDGEIEDSIHMFAVPALLEAAQLTGNTQYKQAVNRAVNFYKGQSDVLSEDMLTHFWAYVVDGFIDCGQKDFVRPAVKKIFSRQRPDGSISGTPKARWVCTVGLAQLGIIALKLSMIDQAKLALSYLLNHQEKTGGFKGSLGLRASYFPKEEISWANKFFLDFVRMYFVYEEKLDVLMQQSVQRPLLDPAGWHQAITAQTSPDVLAAKIRHNDYPVWIYPVLEHTQEGDSVLEIGSGSGELAAILSLYSRKVKCLDYSEENLSFSKELFETLDIRGEFFCLDMFQKFPFKESSLDWVFSSGVLEHYTQAQILDVLKQSAAVCRKGVMSLVPNAHSLFYRIGKYKLEKEGRWMYGHEQPIESMKPLFEQAGLKNIKEDSIGTYHALEFWGKIFDGPKNFFDSLTKEELSQLNQGYLLFTYGEKNG